MAKVVAFDEVTVAKHMLHCNIYAVGIIPRSEIGQAIGPSLPVRSVPKMDSYLQPSQ